MTYQRALFILFLLIIAYSQADSGLNATVVGDSSTSGSESKKDSGDGVTFLIILCSILGGPLIGIFLYWGYVRLRKVQKRKQVFQNHRARYRALKKDTIPEEEYKERLKVLVNLMEEVKVRTKIFSFYKLSYQRRIVHQIIIASFATENKEKFETQITIRASDYLGDWQGRGGFILTETGPFFWMVKWYDKQLNFFKTDRYSIVFESSGINRGGAKGQLIAEGREENNWTWQITRTTIMSTMNNR